MEVQQNNDCVFRVFPHLQNHVLVHSASTSKPFDEIPPGPCHSHRHCRLLRQGDATKQFLLRLCLSFLSVSHACLGVGANLEVRFNLDPFGKKSDEDLLGDNLSEEGARALLADLRGMLQLQELWEAFAEFTASPASVTEVDSISSPLVSHCVCCALPLSCGAVASSESFLLA